MIKARVKNVRKLLSVVLAVVLVLTVTASGAAAAITVSGNGYEAVKISNSNSGSGEVDGFLEGGDRMNSYAWSMGETEDYIFVGTNRNILLASAMYGGESFTQLSAYLDLLSRGELPAMDFSDMAARLFMIDKKTNEVKLAYTSPYINGRPLDSAYRSANATFKPEGSDSESYYFASTGTICTRILRIDKGFDPNKGDEPIEILRFNGKATIRAMTVYNNKLTFAVALPNEGPVVYMSSNPGGIETWEKVASISDFDAFVGTEDLHVNGFINQVLPFNGSLYVAFSNSQAVQSDSGFMLYKGTYVGEGIEGANSVGWKWEAIIADGSGKFAKGMGDFIAVMGTMCAYTDENGEEYMYVGTTSDPFTAIFPALTGDFTMIYNVLNNPIKLYRFDKNDNWELVLGTPEKEQYFTEKLGNLYGGFETEKQDFSCEQYAWALTEHNGKLFIGTFDVSTLMKYITIGVDNEKFADFFKMSDEETDKAVESLTTAIASYLEKNRDKSLSDLSRNLIRRSLKTAIRTVGLINPTGTYEAVQYLGSSAVSHFNMTLNLAETTIESEKIKQLILDSDLGNTYMFACVCAAVADTERGSGL